MEELRRTFANRLIDKISDADFIDFDLLDSDDADEAFEAEQYLVELCQLVFDEMKFVQAAISEEYFVALPTDDKHFMSEVTFKLPIEQLMEGER